MAVLVDDARWEWRGRRWAHLVSDLSHGELHEFARALGARRLGFQGDHYDVDAIDRERAVELGARRVDSRELVRRLREAGLRERQAKPAWRRRASWPSGVTLGDVPAGLRRRVRDLAVDTTLAEAALFEDARHRVLLLDFPGAHEVPAVARPVATGARADGSWSIELFEPGLSVAADR